MIDKEQFLAEIRKEVNRYSLIYDRAPEAINLSFDGIKVLFEDWTDSYLAGSGLRIEGLPVFWDPNFVAYYTFTVSPLSEVAKEALALHENHRKYAAVLTVSAIQKATEISLKNPQEVNDSLHAITNLLSNYEAVYGQPVHSRGISAKENTDSPALITLNGPIERERRVQE